MLAAHTLSPTSTPHRLVELVRDAVHRYTPGGLRRAREDIGQDVLASIIARVNGSADLDLTPAYVRRTARNTTIDHLRSGGRRKVLFELNRTMLERAPGRDPEQRASNLRLGQAIGEHIDRLPTARREAVSLFLAGHGVTEIAARTGRQRKQVDNLVYRGLAALRASLCESGITPQALVS